MSDLFAMVPADDPIEVFQLADKNRPHLTTDPLERGVRLTSADRKRFEYRRMTSDDFAQLLRECDLAPNAFCRIFGTTPLVANDWLKGKRDIPTWVFPALRMMRDAPGALVAARDAAAEHIEFDNRRPERGRFPYLKT